MMSQFIAHYAFLLLLLPAFLVCLFVFSLLRSLWWQPRRIWMAFQKQGIRGPPDARFISGHLPQIMDMRTKANFEDMHSISHNIASRIFSHVSVWTKLYGKTFMYMWGPEIRLAVTDPEILKDILSPKNGNYWGKTPLMITPLLDIVGRGLIWSEGETWAEQRRIVAPAFHMENMKGLAVLMQQCADRMVNTWASRIHKESNKEIEAHREFIKYSADVISFTEFGSSFERAMKIFEKLGAIEKLVQKGMRYMWIPGHRYTPTRERLQIWKLRKEVRNLLKEVVHEREKKSKLESRDDGYGRDMLGLMLARMEDPTVGRRSYTVDWIMDEIKTFFIAAHETTALLLTWAMMLLALHPSWQEKLRQEVIDVCGQGDDPPSTEALGKLKMMTMVLNESLRLYTPVATVARKSLADMQLGPLFVPKNCGFFIPLAYIHHDKDLWGADADEFKPERFAEGGARACKHPMGFLPFSFGARNCIGQAFAIMEAKIAFVKILRHFRFQLSPQYRHAPVAGVTLYPKHGMQILLDSI